MQFVLALTVIFGQISLIDLFQVTKIIRTFGIDTFMDNKVFTVLFTVQGVAAVGTAKIQGREAVALFRRETGITDFAEELAFGAVVLVEILGWGFAPGTGAVFGDITFLTAAYRLNKLPVAFFPIREQILISPILTIGLDDREFVDLNFWYLGEWESSKAHCLRGMYLQIKLISQQFC